MSGESSESLCIMDQVFSQCDDGAVSPQGSCPWNGNTHSCPIPGSQWYVVVFVFLLFGKNTLLLLITVELTLSHLRFFFSL